MKIFMTFNVDGIAMEMPALTAINWTACANVGIQK
jgi:hypothetical protein